jgi:hypothetical protein
MIIDLWKSLWKRYFCTRGIHRWGVHQIGPFPYLYRRCKVCDTAQYLEEERPPYGWQRMPSSREVLIESGLLDPNEDTIGSEETP